MDFEGIDHLKGEECDGQTGTNTDARSTQCTLKAMMYFETCEEIQLTVDVQMQITVIMLPHEQCTVYKLLLMSILT